MASDKPEGDRGNVRRWLRASASGWHQNAASWLSSVASDASEASRKASVTLSQLSTHAESTLSSLTSSSSSASEEPTSFDFANHGVTEDLIAFAQSLTLRTFKDTPHYSVSKPRVGPKSNHQGPWDLTVWQEIHARLLLKAAPELNDLRHVLCPRRMPEPTFWHTYFFLVKHVLLSEGFEEWPSDDNESDRRHTNAQPFAMHDAAAAVAAATVTTTREEEKNNVHQDQAPSTSEKAAPASTNEHERHLSNSSSEVAPETAASTRKSESESQPSAASSSRHEDASISVSPDDGLTETAAATAASSEWDESSLARWEVDEPPDIPQHGDSEGTFDEERQAQQAHKSSEALDHGDEQPAYSPVGEDADGDKHGEEDADGDGRTELDEYLAELLVENDNENDENAVNDDAGMSVDDEDLREALEYADEDPDPDADPDDILREALDS